MAGKKPECNNAQAIALDHSKIPGNSGNMTTQEELRELKALRIKIITTMSDAADAATLESYSFSDGNGSQSTKRRNPKDLMSWLDEVDKKIDTLERKLQGGGIRTFSTNRYG